MKSLLYLARRPGKGKPSKDFCWDDSYLVTATDPPPPPIPAVAIQNLGGSTHLMLHTYQLTVGVVCQEVSLTAVMAMAEPGRQPHHHQAAAHAPPPALVVPAGPVSPLFFP